MAGWLSGLAARDLARRRRRGLDERRARAACSTAAASRSPSSSATCSRYLREREGQPVAREALLRDVWGYEWTGGSNVVEVAVSGLRRKLGDRAGALETVRGVGYRLRAL